jgi:hypothetical protein
MLGFKKISTRNKKHVTRNFFHSPGQNYFFLFQNISVCCLNNQEIKSARQLRNINDVLLVIGCWLLVKNKLSKHIINLYTDNFGFRICPSLGWGIFQFHLPYKARSRVKNILMFRHNPFALAGNTTGR